jgi:hypothetical protein
MALAAASEWGAFAQLFVQPETVPIVLMVGLVALFSLLSLRDAPESDEPSEPR